MLPSLSIVIPAYNEQEIIFSTLEEIHDYCVEHNFIFEMIVVDDASTDNTSMIIADFVALHPRCRVIRNISNIGCHPSVREGFSNAVMDWIVFLPGDGQISPNIITTAVPLMPTHHLLCTNRTLRNDPWHRVTVSRFYNILIRFITGLPISDFDSSILVNREFFQSISPILRSRSASLSVEIAVQTFIHNGVIGEYSIPHRPRVAGIARGLNWRDVRGVPKNLFRMAGLVLPIRFRTISRARFGVTTWRYK